jgi:hypothetical protein
MTDDISNDPTAILMERTNYDGDDSDLSDLSYRSTRLLIGRWRQGVDLEFLIDLMRSEKSRDRLRAAYYLVEIGDPIEELKAPATEFASDPLSYCKRAFVAYMTASGYYDKTIAKALERSLAEIDLYVRATAIKWAIQTSDDRFEDFSRLALAGTGRFELKFHNPLANDFWGASLQRRASRALEIIRRLRDGEEIQHIRAELIEEDSFVFDTLVFAKTHQERAAEWRKMKSKG